MNEEIRELNNKVDVLIKLIFLGLSAEKTQAEAIEMLSKISIPPKKIAEIVGTTSNTVNVTINRSKKKIKSLKNAK